MAHELNINKRTGRASTFYVGDVPWHGLGTKLNEPATAIEAIRAAQLDYEVGKFPLKAEVPDHGKPMDIRVPAKYLAAVRTDTNDVLGIVGHGYKIVQNAEAFDFFDEVVGKGQAIYHTAGALGHGERVWLLAKLPKNLVLAREDIVEKYLVLANSHDGSSALKLYFTSIRVVCSNTLHASLKDAGDGISIRHSGNIASKVKEAQRVLGISIKYYQEFEELCKQLVATPVTKSKVEGYYDRILYGEVIDEKKEESSVLKNRKNEMLYLFEHGKGNDMRGVKHTAWAMLNGATEYYSQYRKVKNEEQDPTNRLKSIWFGSTGRAIEHAFNVAVQTIQAR